MKKNLKDKNYEAPVCCIVEVANEGVLCASMGIGTMEDGGIITSDPIDDVWGSTSLFNE